MHESGLYLNDWYEEGVTALKAKFGLNHSDLDGIEVLLASYSRDAFCGEAFVLFRRGQILYEVNASHDSDGGMDGQWEPEETFVAALRYRLENGRLGICAGGINSFDDELRFLLAELEAEGFR